MRIIKKKSKLWLLPVVLIILFVIVFLSDGLSSLIKFGSFGVFGFSKSTGYELYALSLGEYGSEQEASSVASGAVVRGAGGYIYKSGDNYHVLACVYPNNTDASSVAKGINDYNCSIVKLSYKSVNINIKNIDKQQKQIVEDSVNYLHSVYSTMYDNVIKLDTKDISSIMCSNNFNYIKSQCKTNVANVMKINNNINNSKLGEIINCYIKVIDSIDNCINQLLQSNNASFVAKYALCEVCVNAHNLYNAL